MPTNARQDEGAFGSLLALLVVGGFLALAAHLTDGGGPIDTVIIAPATDAPAILMAHPEGPEPGTEHLLADQIIRRG